MPRTPGAVPASQRSPGAFPLLTAVRVACHNCLAVQHGDLPHVTRCIDAFLDDLSPKWTLATAYAKSPRLRLLQLLAAREPVDMDPSYRWSILNDAAALAAGRGDLETLRWLIESYFPGEFLTEVVSAASAGSHLDILEWLYDHHRDRGYWGGLEMSGAIWKQDAGVIDWLKTHAVPREDCASKLMEIAAAQGDQSLVEWLYSCMAWEQMGPSGRRRINTNGRSRSGFSRTASWQIGRSTLTARLQTVVFGFSSGRIKRD
ncbi:hypothetical protein BBJ28_00025864 [Nothophytophthora sp. Chile5]|nr:hypothetical protein BBJ28_00025864 [Nothophytophthora sp. Chile5]